MKNRPLIIQCSRDMHEFGGISGVACALEKEFEAKGFATARFTIENLPFGKYLKSKNISNLYLAKIHLFFAITYYTIVGTIVLLFKNNNNNIILCHGDVLVGDIYINHGLHKSVLEQNGYLKMFLRNPLHVFIYLREEFRHRFSHHKVVIAFSKEDADALKKYYPIKSKIMLVPNGIDAKRFYKNINLRDQYRELNNISTEFVLIFIGHEFDRKGLKVILESLVYLEDNVILWVLGGNASMASKYMKIAKKLQVEKKVKFFGFQKETNAYINASDIMILASSIEPWGLVGLESMSASKPLVSTATHGVKEYLEHGVNGLFVAREGKDIALKVKLIQGDSNLYSRMSNNARKTAEKYNWGNIAKQYIQIIDSVLKEKNA